MKKLLLALFLSSCTAMPAPAMEVDKEGRIVMTAEEKKTCEAQGGCAVVSLRWVQELIEATKKECKADWKGAA